ncbi:uncharacterized protein DUF4336 [Hephaestia caeni]|uniref:Uncharacterized protein DUF4336 n=1 Tax=Hephaestia caeni TaxID=645617 RepID=A0A397PES9_9SPHN|nr:DUF4336 domain-containing protein [Hephaestia caeni]RIA45667.1 uncharacterized protein DUF4336 [Hephaestia caeni]
MPDAFIPYAPLDVPKPVAERVWIVDGPEIRMEFAGFGMPFPTRMTIIRLADGGLWIHSPTTDDERVFAAVAALGPVRHLIAPNTIHYWWVPDWHRRFPGATVHLAPGVNERSRRPLPPHRVLGDRAPEEWADEIDQVLVPGGLMSEVDFFHRASRTLVLTDLIENIEPRRVKNMLYRWLIRLGGAADPDGKAPRDMQWSFRKHRAEVRRAVEAMIGWAPERILLAHGRWYAENGTAELHRAFRWVL